MIISIIAIVLAVLAGLAVWAHRRLVLIGVSGPSMLPTLQDGQQVLVYRSPPVALRTGQLVVVSQPPPWRTLESWWDGRLVGPEGFWNANRPEPRPKWLIKRVAATAGEPLPPALTPHAPHLGQTVPAGHIAVLGDNPQQSFDSRGFGYVDEKSVLGTVLGHR